MAKETGVLQRTAVRVWHAFGLKPKGLDVYLVMDNYGTHKTPKVKHWLARCPHWHVHYTPTSASWPNLVERFFAQITTKRVRHAQGIIHCISQRHSIYNDELYK